MAIIDRRATGPLSEVRVIINNTEDNFAVATGAPGEVKTITAEEAAAILGGGTVGSLSLQAPNGDFYSVGVSNGGLLTAVSQSVASNSVVLKAADGSCYSLAVTNGGVLTLTSGRC